MARKTSRSPKRASRGNGRKLPGVGPAVPGPTEKAPAFPFLKRKDDFLAMLSHELRTPLAALRSAAEIIGATEASAAALEQARAVLGRQTLNMGRMVDDLLDVARVSHGTIQLRPVPTDLLDAVRHGVETTTHERAATAQKLTLSLPTRPVRVMADPVRLDQVFVNLLINASKFTPRGGQIWVAVQHEPSTATPGHAVVTVRDNGIGIEADALPRVFEVFRDMHRAPTHARRGMGLGLALAQTLVGLHGGTIEARSEGVDRGTEFVVRLPLLPAQAPGEPAPAPRAAPAPVAVTPRRILVVDDNADAAQIMRVLLELDGHQVETAYDGPGALAAAVKLPAEIVLLDLGIPGMDGYAIARAMRADPRLKGVTIIAVTGYAREEDMRRTREAGFDHHLAKPVQRRTLQKLFARVPRQA